MGRKAHSARPPKLQRLSPRAWALLAVLLLAGAAYVAALLEPAPGMLAGRPAVSDGDTLRLGGERVRLVGIDAPERDQICQDAGGRDWACGTAARDRLAALVAGGRLTCTGEGHDRYGRVLASCRTAAGVDPAARLAAEGLAVADRQYEAEEAAARAAGRGLWGGAFDRPEAWRERSRGTGGAADPWQWPWPWFGS